MMANAPMISVVMPVYNAERYVARAVASILCQTVKDFELILLDDGSSDSSLRILRDHADRDGRIRLISRENRGVPATLNEGISMSRGKWIARMDADDVACPERFALQLNWITATKADLCGGWINISTGLIQRLCRYPVSHEAIISTMPLCSPFAHPTVMMRADIARANPYPCLESAQDYGLWLTLASKNVRFANIPAVLLQYRIHRKQISSSRVGVQRTNSLSIIDNYLRSHSDEGAKLSAAIRQLYEGNLSSQEIALLLEDVCDAYRKTAVHSDNHELLAMRDLFVKVFRNSANPSFQGYLDFRRTAVKFGIPAHDLSLLVQMILNLRKRRRHA